MDLDIGQSLSVAVVAAMTYVFNQSTLMLEGVTLGELVEFVVEVLVDLASGSVLDQQTSENS